ncbi:MFS transporter small subunit [Streptomyces sp. NPDC001070]
MTAPSPAPTAAASTGHGRTPLMVVAWLWVGAPFAYGVYELGLKLKQLFTG